MNGGTFSAFVVALFTEMYVYRRPAISEERVTRARFGARWDAYAAGTPRFIPRRRPQAPPSGREEASAS